MLHTANGRILAVILLLTGLAVLCPLYAQQPINSKLGVYPGSDEFVEAPAQYIGNTVVTEGIVQQVSPLVIKLETTQGLHEITIVETTLRPEVGEKARVFGTLSTAQTVRSLHGFVVPQGGLWYTWSVSFLAGLWVLARLMRHRTVEWSQLRFQRRESSVSLKDALTIPLS